MKPRCKPTTRSQTGPAAGTLGPACHLLLAGMRDAQPPPHPRDTASRFLNVLNLMKSHNVKETILRDKGSMR